MKPICLAAITLIAASSTAFAQQPLSPPKPPVGVPTDARFFDGRWYRVYMGQINWKDAKAKCEQLGGRLAVIHDGRTNTFILGLAKKLNLWLGAFEKSEGVWQWVDGTPIDFEGWVEGQPDDHQALDMLITWEGGWADNRNMDKGVLGFICEWKGK